MHAHILSHTRTHVQAANGLGLLPGQHDSGEGQKKHSFAIQDYPNVQCSGLTYCMPVSSCIFQLAYMLLDIEYCHCYCVCVFVADYGPPTLMCHLIHPTPWPLKSLHTATQSLLLFQSALCQVPHTYETHTHTQTSGVS